MAANPVFSPYAVILKRRKCRLSGSSFVTLTYGESKGRIDPQKVGIIFPIISGG